jgi:hypothetical protein
MPKAKKQMSPVDLVATHKDIDARFKRMHLTVEAGAYIGEERIIYGFSEYQLARIVRSDNPLGCTLLADEGDWQEEPEHGIERAIRNGRPPKRTKRKVAR